MKQLVGLAGVLLAASAGAGQPGRFAMPASITTPEDAMAGHNGAAGLICETSARHRPAPKLEVTITPPKVKIPDNSKRGTRLAKVTVFGGATESRFAARSGSPKTQAASVICLAWSYN